MLSIPRKPPGNRFSPFASLRSPTTRVVSFLCKERDRTTKCRRRANIEQIIAERLMTEREPVSASRRDAWFRASAV
jgi:hypothetical protein